MKREELLKIAKPIIFNTEMVQAILEDRKTVTRRIIKPKYKADERGFSVITNKGTGERWVEKHDWDEGLFDNPRYVNPPYQVGGILYVKETFRYVSIGEEDSYTGEGLWDDEVVEYKASQEEFEKEYGEYIAEYDKWKPSIHMPKFIARIFLKVTDVRVERLKEMTLADLIKEGIWIKGESIPTSKFIDLWNSTIKKQDLDKYGWDANPWVWVIEFEKEEVK